MTYCISALYSYTMIYCKSLPTQKKKKKKKNGVKNLLKPIEILRRPPSHNNFKTDLLGLPDNSSSMIAITLVTPPPEAQKYG